MGVAWREILKRLLSHRSLLLVPAAACCQASHPQRATKARASQCPSPKRGSAEVSLCKVKNRIQNLPMAVRIAVGAVAGIAATAAFPVVAGMLGFTGAGIAAGSTAASMMSASAIASGGGVAAGSLVAVMQSVGAAGVSAATSAAGAAGGALLGVLSALF